MSKLSVNSGNRNLQDSHKNQNPDPVYITIGKTHKETQHNYHDNPIHALVGLFGTSYLVSES